MSESEIIVAAAIRRSLEYTVDAGASGHFSYGTFDLIMSVPKPGRHHHVLNIASLNKVVNQDEHHLAYWDQGFLTNTGRFVDRKEGCTIARAANQIVQKTGPEEILFSEDMW